MVSIGRIYHQLSEKLSSLLKIIVVVVLCYKMILKTLVLIEILSFEIDVIYSDWLGNGGSVPGISHFMYVCSSDARGFRVSCCDQ